MRRSYRFLRGLWLAIAEPRHLKAAYATIYAVTFLTGIATLADPPRSVAGELGGTLTLVWGLSLVVGAVAGGLSVLPGWWFWERMGILLVWLGLGIYFVVVLWNHLTQDGSRLTQVGAILLAVLAFVVRWVSIRKYSFEPRTGA